MEAGSTGRRRAPELTASRACAALNVTGSRYLVIGGVACILHGHVRATSDVDVLIEPTTDNAARVLRGLESLGYGFAREWLPAEIVGRAVTVIGDDPAVDIFTVAWTVRYADAVARSTTVHVEDVPIPLIGLGDLIASKRTGRLQDAADIEVLEQIRQLRDEQA